MRLLPREALIKTSELDYAEWNFSNLLGFIQRMRFNLVVSLLSGHKFQRLLEVGYGSGIFMPELVLYCDELYGIDLHHKEELVSEALAKFNIPARLFHGSVAAMPFNSDYFDCIVAVSTLEFVEDADTACKEVKRVLKPGGIFIVIIPGGSPIVDLGLWVLTGKKANDVYGQRRESVMSTLPRHFTLSKKLLVPPYGNSVICLYRGVKLLKSKLT